MSLSSNATAPTAASYVHTATINQSGSGYTLAETITESYVMTVTGNSAAGSYVQSLAI